MKKAIMIPLLYLVHIIQNTKVKFYVETTYITLFQNI